ncbi:hypothetical protein IHE51_01285 [Candidatus Parvarchaeota archaeon]|jgi:hypothetical protein|uniref:Uncharacterized protein n=1 Tax=Candidatus Acidifodinimicrobium mancum TaxID=2898728 RepID=A0A8T3UT00_9ARCH|nr:hypothetical protein [Candidatus Acidifodinimicrobium mancum]MBE5728473.1 hypothetical protein [Candidatus Acidifodinimicrobium mancum]MBE5728965.1 hypothetical protein [Candidatus Acidifodinimicrobium mancum]MBE5729256.1 hypothetical protein [Candidatus Acidifodinimicrobium mancum]MBE5729942.1 hypothetical protein [Candidatus Acidifodinimicrobium mancum]
MEFKDIEEPSEKIVREGSNNFIKINLTKGKEGEREITFISIKKGYTVQGDSKQERIKTSLSINFDELPLLIDALTEFKKKLESSSFNAGSDQ